MGLIILAEPPLQLVGQLTVTEVDASTQEIVSVERTGNLTLLLGKRLALELLFGQHARYLAHIAAGDGATLPVIGDTALVNELIRGPLVSVLVTDNGASGLLTARYIMGTTQGNGSTFREAGLFNVATQGEANEVCYARVIHADKAKLSTKILIYQWDLTLT